MSKITLSVAVLAVATAFAISSLPAQETPGSATPQRPGMMDQGGMMGGDMSGMMSMMRMMDQCSRMMQSMLDRPGPKAPDQPPK
jgi:hypothetical protein